MAKKIAANAGSKKGMLEMVEKSLETLLVKLDPGMGEKKFRKKIKEAGKILVRGIKIKKAKAEPAAEPKEKAVSV